MSKAETILHLERGINYLCPPPSTIAIIVVNVKKKNYCKSRCSQYFANFKLLFYDNLLAGSQSV